MRTIAWETAFLIALKNCSKDVERKGIKIYDFGEGGVHAIKHFFQKFSASLLRVTASDEEWPSP